MDEKSKTKRATDRAYRLRKRCLIREFRGRRGGQGEVSRGCVWTDNRKAKRRENWGAEGGQSSVKIEKLFRSGSDEGGGEVGGGRVVNR